MYELLKAKSRDSKLSAKNMRKQGHIPGIIFGKEFDSVSIHIPSTTLSKFLSRAGKVFELEIEGQGKHLVSLDTIQKDALGNSFMHVAFHKLSKNVKATVTLPIHLTGTPVGAKEGGVWNQTLSSVEVKGLPADMPEAIEVDIAELGVGAHWTLADIKLPKGLEFSHSLEDSFVSCSVPKLEVVEEVAEEVTAEVTEVVEEEKVAA